MDKLLIAKSEPLWNTAIYLLVVIFRPQGLFGRY